MKRLMRITFALSCIALMAQTDPGCALEPKLEDMSWVSIPDSSMIEGGPIIVGSADSGECATNGGYWTGSVCQLFDPDVDQRSGWPADSWGAIQDSWSGAVCDESNDELILVGGGHGDGNNNTILAVNVLTGDWRRITQPSFPTWQDSDSGAAAYCASGTCSPPFGGDCAYGTCNVAPDGARTSIHSYDLLAFDSGYLYNAGGSVWFAGSSGFTGTRTWRLRASDGTWEMLTDRSSGTLTTGGIEIVDGVMYHAFTSFNASTYTIATDSWTTGSMAKSVGTHSQLLYVPTVDKLFALTGGVAWSIPIADWPDGASTDLSATGCAALGKGCGLTYYPPEDLILIWNGGQTIETLDPNTDAWSSVTPGGETPGAAFGAGTWGRFSYCGGRLVLVDGVTEDLFYVQ